MKKIKIIFLVIILFPIICIILVCLNHSLNVSGRLKISYNNIEFFIPDYLIIDSSRISSINEVKNIDKFLQYNCVIDSNYYLSIINLGKTNHFTFNESILISPTEFKIRDKHINTSMAFPGPYKNYLFSPHKFLYNVKKLPFNHLNRISLYIDSCQVDKYYYNPSIIVYDICSERSSTYITASFNSENISDLIIYNRNKTMSLFFINDENGVVYLGVLSSKDYNNNLKSLFKQLFSTEN